MLSVLQMPYRPTYLTLMSPYFNFSVYRPICILRKLYCLNLVYFIQKYFPSVHLILVVQCLENRAYTAMSSARHYSPVFSHVTHLSVLFTHVISLPSQMSIHINDITSVTNPMELSQEIQFLLPIVLTRIC